MKALYWVGKPTLKSSKKEDRTAWVKTGDENGENFTYRSVMAFSHSPLTCAFKDLKSGLLAGCRNISGHTLMGRPAARLETMVLVFSSYVVVFIVDKSRCLSLYGCYFLIYVIRRPFSLDISLTGNRTLFNV